MNFGRGFAITGKLVNQMRHEPRTLVLMFLAPLIAMFVFGLAFSGDVSHVKIIVVNHDAGISLPFIGKLSLSENILKKLDPLTLDLSYVKTDQEGIDAVKKGQAQGVVIFPENFTSVLFSRLNNQSTNEQAAIELRLDKTIYTVAATVQKTFLESMMNAIADNGQTLPVTIDTDNAIYGRNAKFMDFFVPGVMGFAGFFLTSLLTIITFIGERRSGTLERLLATPLKPGEIIFGYAFFFGCVGIIQSGLLLSVAILAFGITIVGSALLAFGIVSLLALASLSLGILLSTLAKTEIQAVQMLPLLVLPTFLLAGIFWPVESIPLWLRPLSYLLPPFYAVEAVRSIMIRGWNLLQVWKDVVMLVVFATLFLVASTASLRKGRV